MLDYTKKCYTELLIANGDLEEAYKKSLLDTYDPLFEPRVIHPEEIPLIREYNTMIAELANDLSALHYEIEKSGNQLKELSDSITLRLQQVEANLLEEKMVRNHMHMLCNAYENFDDMIIIDNFKQNQTCSYLNGSYRAGILFSEKVPYDIVEINGNGTAGNAYVLNLKDEFIETSINSYLPQAMRDEDKQTYYDYQRLIIGKSDTYFVPEMYQDNIPARCDILLKASKEVQNCSIYGNSFLLNGLYFSNNGLSFSNALVNPILLNQNQQTISNSFLTFPSGNYLKLSIESVGSTQEQIGFIGYEKDKASNSTTGTQRLFKLTSGKRQLIRINELSLENYGYMEKSYFKTSNLLPYPVQAVAFYADIYYPEHATDKSEYVQFQLFINNVPFDVLPINSNENGTKIIATSVFDLGEKYSGKYINEPIVDVKFNMTFNCKIETESAIVKNIRLLIGESYESK